MNSDEIRRYFDKNPPPEEVAWKPWAKITDTQKFLDSCYSSIGSYKGNIESCPAWWHLKEFYEDMLLATNAGNSAGGNTP